MQSIKILPLAEMEPEADPLLREGGKRGAQGGEGWKEVAWMVAMGFCAAGKKAVGSGCVDLADNPGRKPGRQDAHEKHEQGVLVSHRADELRALLRGAPGHELPGVFGAHTGLLVVLHHGDGARDAAVIDNVAVAALAPCGGEAGGNVTRHDNADLDAEGTHLACERERIRAHGGLGGRVVRLKRNGDRRGNGAHVHDAAAALLPHDGQDCTVHVHHAEKVHIKLPPGLLRRRELDRAGDAEARIVDENVDAPLAAQNLRHGGVHLRFVRHVCLQVRYARLRVFGAAAELIHVETAAAQGTRGVQADARTAAGDDGHARFGGG